jgi:lipid-binding SYLF domain-containing protein
MPLVVTAIAPAAGLIPFVAGSSLVFLALLGGLAAHAGGAGVLVGAMRVTFWGALAMAVTAGVGALFGTFQIGASETDVVLLVMNDGGMRHLLSDKFTIGGDASAAAGPVGRDVSAQTDAMMNAEMLSYSRSQGLFAGISLDRRDASSGWGNQQRTLRPRHNES